LLSDIAVHGLCAALDSDSACVPTPNKALQAKHAENADH